MSQASRQIILRIPGKANASHAKLVEGLQTLKSPLQGHRSLERRYDREDASLLHRLEVARCPRDANGAIGLRDFVSEMRHHENGTVECTGETVWTEHTGITADRTDGSSDSALFEARNVKALEDPSLACSPVTNDGWQYVDVAVEDTRSARGRPIQEVSPGARW